MKFIVYNSIPDKLSFFSVDARGFIKSNKHIGIITNVANYVFYVDEKRVNRIAIKSNFRKTGTVFLKTQKIQNQAQLDLQIDLIFVNGILNLHSLLYLISDLC